jgi:hypothetical protein
LPPYLSHLPVPAIENEPPLPSALQSAQIRWHRLDAEALRYYITGDRQRSPPMPAARLAVVTGVPAQVLRYAIPDLDPDPSLPAVNQGGPWLQRPGDDGPACQMCVLARGIGPLAVATVGCLVQQRPRSSRSVVSIRVSKISQPSAPALCSRISPVALQLSYWYTVSK